MTQPDDPGVTPPLKAEHQRLLRILGRHIRPEDMLMEDVPFLLTGIGRWERAMAEPVIDVNE